MSNDEGTLKSTANISDNYLIPVTSDKERIICPDNDAYIAGTLYEFGRWAKRCNLLMASLPLTTSTPSTTPPAG